MCAKAKKPERFREVRNPKARHDFFVGESFEAGIVLQGTEVKAIRAGGAQIKDAFARVERGEVWLYHAHIGEYKFGNRQNHEPKRKRKLLLHRREIHKMQGAVEMGGKTLVPLRLYLKGGRVKVEIAIAAGKKRHDKRETMKRKIAEREAAREMARRR